VELEAEAEQRGGKVRICPVDVEELLQSLLSQGVWYKWTECEENSEGNVR